MCNQPTFALRRRGDHADVSESIDYCEEPLSSSTTPLSAHGSRRANGGRAWTCRGACTSFAIRSVRTWPCAGRRPRPFSHSGSRRSREPDDPAPVHAPLAHSTPVGFERKLAVEERFAEIRSRRFARRRAGGRRDPWLRCVPSLRDATRQRRTSTPATLQSVSQPIALDQAVEALRRDPTHAVRARVGDMTVELRAVSDSPAVVERSAADALREIGSWEGET
jgi:hypothetical protein